MNQIILCSQCKGLLNEELLCDKCAFYIQQYCEHCHEQSQETCNLCRQARAFIVRRHIAFGINDALFPA